MDIKFRELEPDEIEVRAAQCFEYGAKLLLYKDARVDMAILDETVGAMNWQRQHSRDNANCTVSIWDTEKGQWVCKEDTGTESNTEKEKGLCSDSFKRSCTTWGIGRSLYSSPDIFIRVKCELNKSGKGYQLPKDFKPSVSVYETDKGKITRLELVDQNGAVIYTWEKKKAVKPSAPVSKVDYSMGSSGTAKAAPAPVAAPVPVEEEEDIELPVIDFGENTEARPAVETESEYNENEATVKFASIFKSKNGSPCLKLVYAMEHKPEDEEQVQPIGTKYGIGHAVDTIRALGAISEDRLKTVSVNDISALEDAVKELAKNGRNYHCEVKSSVNARGYKEFNIKRI